VPATRLDTVKPFMLAPALSCKLSSHNDQLMNKNCKLLFEASFQVLKTNLNDAAVLSRLDSIDSCKISCKTDC